MRSVLFGLLVVVVAGCSDPLSPKEVVGAWDEAFNIPGNFRHMMLDTSTASELFGGGSFCGEAGPCGTFTVAGTISGDAVHLVFSYSNGTTTAFDGRLIDSGTLTGNESTPGPTLPLRGVTFHRSRSQLFQG